MNQEIVFAQTLEKVRRLSREQGNSIREEQVRESFAGLELGEAQMEMVFDYLRKHNVGIGEPADQDAYLTEEERDYLQMYLDEIEELPVYSDGQREAFAMSVMAGDRAARQQLTESFLREVADIARLYAGQGVPLEDLIGEGNMALALGTGMLCRDEAGIFPKKPAEVQGVLVRGIMEAMEEFIRENADHDKKEKSVAERVNRVADKAREMAGELQRKVTPEELARETGMSLKYIRDAIRMSGYRIEDMEYAEERV